MLNSILVALALTGAPEGRELVDRIVAVVNDDVIIASELDDAARLRDVTDKRAVLEELINERLMMQQIREANIDISDDEVDRAIQDILRTNRITEAELRAAVTSRGLSMSQYREDLKSQLIRLKLIDAKVRSRVVIPEAEMKAEFERQTRDEAKEELVRIRHIFLRYGDAPTRADRERVLAQARVARQRILQGASFEEVAQQISDGPTASQGGDLGEMSRQQMLPELSKGIEGLEPGQLTQPIDTSNGVHVVRLESRRLKGRTSYAELRNAIYQKLYEKEVEAQMTVWLEELRKQAAVSIKL